ncbi:response regulator transcription factor [Lederbergia citri]|uniref:AraC family transcriptional regulator n=1 Tax=Lederbergia citri TaxID=2833580 RepID=A0A942TG66_9BACI|nr:AraC family transcriptional regulator [Lederbergia citri]MBS4196186.1 AraC family transcriptional regulator [Lederbergia citri]
MNILLLDDEPIELEQLELLIHSHFPTWNIYKALFGSKAIEMAEEMVKEGKQFQLALMDIKLPGRNGLEIAENLKSFMPSLELIIVSAFQNFDYAKQSIHLKAIDYLVKPVVERELIDSLQLFLNEHPEYNTHTEVVQEVIQLVNNNYQKSLKLAEIAKQLHINVSYLSRLFSEEVGSTFSDYLLNYRIEKAKSLLLLQRNWSIQRVAEECGFNSPHYFSNAFKKIANCTPKEYRNKGIA